MNKPTTSRTYKIREEAKGDTYKILIYNFNTRSNMKDKTKLKLVSDNPNLKTYYVPLTTIHVEMYPVKANSLDDAVDRANKGLSDGIVRKVTLEESFTNDAYNYPDPPTTELFARQIDHFELNIKDFDYPIPNKGS